MELRALVGALAKQWKLIAALTLAVFTVSVVVTLAAQPQYEASTRVYVTTTADGSVGELLEGSGYVENVLGTYTEVVKSSPVLAPVIQTLGLQMSPGDLSSSIWADVPAGTQFIDITATSTDPARAAQIADAAAEQFIGVVEDMATVTPDPVPGSVSPAAPETSPVALEVFEEAAVPADPVSPNTPWNLALGLALGLMLGIVVALLREALDSRIRDEDDVAKVTLTPVLGAIPAHDHRRRGGQGTLFVAHHPSSAQAEGMRRLRTNLTYVGLVNGIGSVVVTSAVTGEGKSSIALNLAQSMADSGVRTLLVDADLRRPAVADYLGLEGQVGLTTVLIGQASLGDAVQVWGTSGLSVLPSGDLPPNPGELLASEAMRSLVARLSQAYEFVVFDSPPVQPVADAIVLGKEVGGVLVVVESGKSRQVQLKESLEALQRVKVNLIGIVLNKVRGAGARDTYHSHSSDTEGKDGEKAARRALSTTADDEAPSPDRIQA